MIRMGASPSAVRAMFQTLQLARHHIQTAYGRATKHYGQDFIIPLQGIGQGNGCGPTGWTVISAPIIELMRSHHFGFSTIAPLSSKEIAFVCYAFVDDTDLVHSLGHYASGEDLLPNFQLSLDMWAGGLKATGGALVPAKSSWCLIDFKWDGSH